MELMRPHSCIVCGQHDESQFVYSGPHIKQVCNGCGSYIKFVSKSFIPDSGEIRLKIWTITKDIDYINLAKGISGFVDGLSGLDKSMVYWRLYLQLLKMESVS